MLPSLPLLCCAVSRKMREPFSSFLLISLVLILLLSGPVHGRKKSEKEESVGNKAVEEGQQHHHHHQEHHKSSQLHGFMEGRGAAKRRKQVKIEKIKRDTVSRPSSPSTTIIARQAAAVITNSPTQTTIQAQATRTPAPTPWIIGKCIRCGKRKEDDPTSFSFRCSRSFLIGFALCVSQIIRRMMIMLTLCRESIRTILMMMTLLGVIHTRERTYKWLYVQMT